MRQVNGSSHKFVAMVAMACLDDAERHILYPRWGGVEAGATLSDEFRIMWEPASATSKDKELVHRCFVDSDDPKDHGCVTRAMDHSEGSISFIRSYLNGELEGSYNEVEFLENLGMFMGVLSHHVADLCTPVHVGSKMDFRRAGVCSRKAFHSKVEQDIDRLMRRCTLQMLPSELVELSRTHYWGIAEMTYRSGFLQLESIYQRRDTDALADLVSLTISRAITHTRDLWHTIFEQGNMLGRTWSMQPLL